VEMNEKSKCLVPYWFPVIALRYLTRTADFCSALNVTWNWIQRKRHGYQIATATGVRRQNFMCSRA